MAKTFEITRKGKFTMDSFCWDDGERELQYHIHIVRPQLDNHGFVVDNFAIETYVRSLAGEHGPNKLSCELIADHICLHLCNALPDYLSIRVSITGNPDATWLTSFANRELQSQWPQSQPLTLSDM